MTINEAGFVYTMSKFLNKLGYNTAFERIYEKHHLNHFTTKSLKRLLQQEGFAIFHQFTHNPKLKSMDTPATKGLNRIFQRTALGILNLFSDLTNTQYLQTIVAIKQ